MTNKFNLIVPVNIEKNQTGNYKIWGLASTDALDLQGEKVLPEGIDLVPVENGKAYFNFEHSANSEDKLGEIEGFKKDKDQFYVYGHLYKNNPKAEALYAIMQSVEDSGQVVVGMSIQGKVVERDPTATNVIKQCKIDQVALTFKPANPQTYAAVMKSMAEAEVTISTNDTTDSKVEAPIFTANQVLTLLTKALTVSQNYGTTPPNQLTGGAALAMESFSPKKAKTDKIENILKELSVLYPKIPQNVLLNALRDRLKVKLKNNML